MIDEKRQTRLLPFRLRRGGAAREGARAGAGGAEDLTADAGLTALLRTWEAPPPQPGARPRLLADFRASVPRAPLWRRALAAQVRVPLPLAACAAGLLLLSLYALGARAFVPAGGVAARGPAPEAAVRFVEVPVVQERVVTRTVYVERKGRGAEQRAATPRAPEREALAAAPAAPAAPGRGPQEPSGPAPAADAQAGYFTRVDMNDFQPADEVKIRIVSRGGVDEK